MNGFTKFEMDTRNKIRDLILEGRCDKARQVARKFLGIKDKARKTKRQGLCRTINFFVTVMNGQDTKTSPKLPTIFEGTDNV